MADPVADPEHMLGTVVGGIDIHPERA